MATMTAGADVRAVTGEFSYLARESTVLRRFTAPGESVNTGTHRAYAMPVRDGRPVRDQFTLDRTLNDSDHSRAWRVPHSAFHDKTARATQPRHSIEFRSVAYFE